MARLHIFADDGAPLAVQNIDGLGVLTGRDSPARKERIRLRQAARTLREWGRLFPELAADAAWAQFYMRGRVRHPIVWRGPWPGHMNDGGNQWAK